MSTYACFSFILETERERERDKNAALVEMRLVFILWGSIISCLKNFLRLFLHLLKMIAAVNFLLGPLPLNTVICVYLFDWFKARKLSHSFFSISFAPCTNVCFVCCFEGKIRRRRRKTKSKNGKLCGVPLTYKHSKCSQFFFLL